MFSQFVNVLNARAALYYEIESVLGESLHHINEAALEYLLGAINVDEYTTQVEKA